MGSEYLDKFDNILELTLFNKLDKANQIATRNIAVENRFTLQELRIFIESAIDLNIWNEENLTSHWHKWRLSTNLKEREFKKWAFNKLEELLAELRKKENDYSDGLAKNPSCDIMLQSTNYRCG